MRQLADTQSAKNSCLKRQERSYTASEISDGPTGRSQVPLPTTPRDLRCHNTRRETRCVLKLTTLEEPQTKQPLSV